MCILGSVESASPRIGRVDARFSRRYAPLCCVRFSEKFEPDEIAFDEMWKECEELYREGKVRALGICNISAPQLERLLEFCEIRPAVYEAEAHILHH